MPFQISEIIKAKPDGLAVKVMHQDHQVYAVLPNKRENDVVVGASFQAEISYDDISGWKIVDDFNDTQSGIWQEPDGVHLLGRIHSVLDYGDGKRFIDVYLQNGPEFFTLSSETIDHTAMEGNSGLEITVGNLYLSER